MSSTLLIVVLAVLAVLNIASFSFMAYDKHCARHGKWRVPEKTLFGIVVLVLEAYALDKVMVFGKAQTQLYIISSRYEEIRSSLLNEMNVGVTLSMIETGLFQNQQKAVLCVIPTRKLYDTTELIHSVDSEAFITITKIKEVRGRGFTEARQNLIPEDKK